ncbi:MAG: chromosome segregation protein SMC, partial [Planctomycetota bacterium]
MRLKRLELFGFKSFADRTVMDFGQNTLTGIVGPNGCGKSNVVDAVRWVLGETRPTSMRGSGMTDVIFKGSASRPAMGTAEVTMVLDNEQATLPDRGPEVAITRRLYASGEGEYAIDGERVRLKDVKDLLFDTGLGSRGYSVLEQGRIDAVLSANPAQRRAIFEEAAGISRYRQRRHETELRLKRCEQDVERLDDVMGELKSRVRSLKIQAGKAERFVVAKAEWTEARTTLLSQRLVGYDAELEALRPKIEDYEAGLASLRERRAECEAAIEEREAERQVVVEELTRSVDAAAQVSGDLRALDERRTQLAMRISSWAASATEESERADALSAQLAEREGELEALRLSIEDLRGRAEAAEARASGLGAQSRELGSTYRSLRTEVQTQNDAVLERLHQRTAAENRLVHLSEALPPARQRFARVVERFSAAEAQIAEIAAAQAAAAAELDGARSRSRLAEDALALSEERVEAERTRLESLRRARSENEVEEAALSSRIEALLDRDRELEDLSGGARRVLEAVREGGGPCREDEILGLVADHLRADVRLARAIDAVLGDRAHALVARDAHVARSVVDWCRTEKVGQIGVVVPPGVGAPDCPPPSDFALFARFGAGVEGRLGDLVQCDEDMRQLVHALFCDVVVVSNLDVALDLVGREPGWRFVTPAGELVDSAGLVGGFREVSQGFVGRRSSAADLEARRSSLQVRGEELVRSIDEVTVSLGAAQTARDEASTARDDARTTAGSAEAKVKAAEARMRDLEAARSAHAEERTKAQSEVDAAESGIAEVTEQRERASEAFEAENERLEQMEKTRRTLEAEREDLRAEEGRAQVELSAAKAELGGLEQRIASSERLIDETRSEIDRSEQRAATYARSASEGEAEVTGIEAEATGMRETLNAHEEATTELRAKERSGQERIRETRRDAEAVQGDLDERSEALGKARMGAQRAELAREELLQRADEELGADAAALARAHDEAGAEMLEPQELGELDRRVADLKKQLDKIGPVNVEAVHELEEVGGRLEHLETQAADLAEARRALSETIRTIDEETRRMFVETFEEVRGNFQRIFRLLFGGGRADIK